MASEAPAPFHKVSERLVHQGATVSFAVGTFRGADGSTFERDIVHHPGAVAVVALDAEGRVVLVRQYRAALDAWLEELPAGKLDVPGEDPALCAQRELAEEVGLSAATWRKLGAFQLTPGFCDEVIHLYLAEHLTPVALDRQGVEEQLMTVERVALADAVARVRAGHLTDAKTTIGLLLAAADQGVATGSSSSQPSGS